MRKLKICVIIVLVFILGVFKGQYVQAADRKRVKEVESLVQDHTSYERDPLTMDIQKEIEHLLSRPLTEDAAVTIAFLNSPVVKAQLASLGISESERREAGLLRNPTFLYSSRSVNEEGSERNQEFEIKQDVFDVLLWPLRKKLAGTRFKMSQYDSAHQLTDFIKSVRLTYLEWLTAKHRQVLAEDHFKAQESVLEISRRQKEAGNINALKMAETQALFQKAKIEWLKMKLDSQITKERLRTILGLSSDQFFMDETVQIEDVPQEDLVLEDLEKKALLNRLDLSMKRQEIIFLKQSVNFSGLGFLPDIEAGYNQEKESSGHKSKGVVVEGEVPLFNRKQAERQGIKSSLETSEYQLDEMEQNVLLEVRLAYQNLMTSRQVVEAYKEALPVYQKIVKETLHHYNFMLTDVFHLLESKQTELETRIEYTGALKDYWSSRIELENAVGSKLTYDQTVPPVQKKENQPKAMEHDHHHGG